MTTLSSDCNHGVDAPNLLIRQYRPGQSRYANRIPEAMWEQMRPDLELLHFSRATRRQMLEHLAHQHNCRPTPSQLNARMVSWGLKAYKSLKVTQNDSEASEINTSVSVIISDVHNDSMQDESTIASYSDTAMEPMNPLEEYVNDALRGTAILNPRHFCILQDVADIFGHSGWGSHISYNILKSLVHTTEEDHIGTDPLPRLILLRNSVMWPIWWSSKIRRDWLIECLARMGVDITRKSDNEACDLDTEITGLLDVHLDVRTVDSIIKECFPDANMGSPNWPYDNTLFLVGQLGLKVHYDTSDLADRLDSSAVEDLLSWCTKQIDRFNLPSHKTLTSASSLLFYRIELTRYLFDRWNNYVAQDEVIVEEGRIDATGCEYSDDLFVFRIVARVLSIVAYLATSSFETDFTPTTLHQDPELVAKIKTALLRSMIEIQSWQTGIFEQMRSAQWSRPSVKAQEEESCLVDNHMGNVKTLALVLAQQFDEQRQNPQSHRHLAALHSLRRQNQPQERTHRSTGPDAMLCSVRSTSSFKSFRRAGISARDRFRPPSVSSISSRLSVSSNKSNSILTAQTITEEWSFDEMDLSVY